MAEPDRFSVPSFGMTVTSLALQMPSTVSEIFTLLGFFAESLEIGDALTSLRYDMARIQERLASWIVASGLSRGEPDYEVQMRSDLIIATFAEIKKLVTAFDSTVNQYGITFNEPVQENKHVSWTRFNESQVQQELRKQAALSNELAARNPALNFRRYIFTAKDKFMLEKTLDRLWDLVSYLHSILPSRLRIAQEGLLRDDELEKVRMVRYENVDELCKLADNARAFGDMDLAASALGAASEKRAKEKEKAKRRKLYQNSDESPFEYDLKGEIKNIKPVGAAFDMAELWADGKLEHRVIIEKRIWETMDFSDPVQKSTALLVRLAMDTLCDILSERVASKPSDLCTLPALGHVIDEKEKAFKLVFALPPTADKVDTLYDLLDWKKFPKLRPGVEERLKLALKLCKCLLRVHEMGWLHKGISSQSILFVRDEMGRTSIEQPLLCAFKHARPDSENEISAEYMLHGKERADLYHHALFEGGRSSLGEYQKSFDTYALGIVLTEIGHWALIGDRDYNRFVAKDKMLNPREFRYLLGKEPTDPDAHKSPVLGLDFRLGEKYRRAVWSCLWQNFDTSSGLVDFRNSVVKVLEEAVSGVL
jgi:hypothetical protein